MLEGSLSCLSPRGKQFGEVSTAFKARRCEGLLYMIQHAASSAPHRGNARALKRWECVELRYVNLLSIACIGTWVHALVHAAAEVLLCFVWRRCEALTSSVLCIIQTRCFSRAANRGNAHALKLQEWATSHGTVFGRYAALAHEYVRARGY